MPHSPAPFLKAADQRGWNAILKMLATAFQADRVVLLGMDVGLQTPEESHFLGFAAKPKAQGVGRYVPLSVEDSFDILEDCYEVLTRKELVRRVEKSATCFYGVPLVDPEGRFVAALGLVGSWKKPFSPALSGMLEEAGQALLDSFPLYRERVGKDEHHFFGCDSEILQKCLDAHDLGFWMAETEDPFREDTALKIHFSSANRQIKGLGSPVSLRSYLEEIHPGDREAFEKLTRMVWQGTPVFAISYRLAGPEGIRHLVISAYPVRDCRGKITRLFGTAQDVTALRKLEHSLQEATRRLHVIMEMADVFYWTLDGDRVVHWPQTPTYFKKYRHLLRGRHSFPLDAFIERVVPEDRDGIHRALVANALGMPVRDVNYRIRIGRSVYHLVSWIYPVPDERGEVVESFGLTQDVTDSKRLEKELFDSNDLFKKASTLGRMGHWRIDFNKKRFEASEELLSLTAFSAPDVSIEELYDRVVPADRAALRSALERIERGEEADVSVRLPKENDFVHYYICGFPIFDASGRATAAFGLLQDVTAQKKLEEELEEANRWLANAMAVGRMGYWKIDWPRRTLIASHGLRRIIDVHRTEIPLETILQLCFPNDRAILRGSLDALREGKEINLSCRITVDSQIKHLFLCGFPIRDAEGNVDSAFGIAQDVSDIRILEARLENYFNAAHSVILVLDPQLRITYANHYAGELLGYDFDDLIGWDACIALIPDKFHASSSNREQLRKVFTDPKESHIKAINENVCLDDSIVWISWSNVVDRDDSGNVREILCIGNDITSLKSVQTRFDLTVDSSGLGFWDMNVPADRGTASSNWFLIRGLEPAPALTSDLFYDLVHPDDISYFKQRIRDHFERKTDIVEVQYRVRHPESEWIWIRTKAKVTQWSSDARPLWFTGFDFDVTREIVDKENIRNSRNLIEQAMELGRMGYWVNDLTQRRIVSHSPLLFSMFGLDGIPPGEPECELVSLFIRIVHPDDFEEFSNNYFSEGDEDKRLTFRARMPDGTTAYFFLHSTPIRDERGNVVSRITVIQDITSQKNVETTLIEQEKAVREKELRYRTLFENSTDAVHVMDGDTVTECNRRTLEIFGYESHADFLGARSTDFSVEYQADGRRSSDRFSELLEQCRQERMVSTDWICRRRDGSTFESTLKMMPLDEEGNVVQVIVHDVTEQKVAARALENYRAYISLLAEIRKTFYSRSEQEIVQNFLDTAAEFFNLQKVWYGVRIGNTIRPVFHAGSAKGFIDLVRIELDSTDEDNCFPLIRAVRDHTPVAVNNLEHDRGCKPWQSFAEKANFHSTLAIPVEMNDKIEGGVVFYSSLPNAFDESIVDYLNSSLKELVRITMEKRRWSHQQRTLKRAKETAEAAAQAKTQFLANMSHEIRTPMTSILGYTEVLLRDHLAGIEDRRRDEMSLDLCLSIIEHCTNTARIIQSNAEYLLSILNDILDFSKMEAEKMTVETIDIPIVPFLNELTSFYSVQAESKNLDFSVKALTPLPEIIRTDPTRLKQVLYNLIGNAVKFTFQGEVAVSVAWIMEDGVGIWQREDDFSADMEKAPVKGNLFFSVKDTGIGITSSQLASLFTPFHQADTSTTRRFGGTGLGLAISKRLIQLLGGDLTISSQEGLGSTFTVILPQAFEKKVGWKTFDKIMTSRSLPVDPESGDSMEEAVSSRQPLTGLRILLAEDGRDNQRLFSFILEKAGAEVSVADNGKIALDLVLDDMRNNIPLDVVLMDMQMPVMDGYNATRHLRQAGFQGPIIALTAHALMEERQKCLDAGCNDYATKPILRDALIETILKNVRRKRDEK